MSSAIPEEGYGEGGEEDEDEDEEVVVEVVEEEGLFEIGGGMKGAKLCLGRLSGGLERGGRVVV